MDDEVRLGVDDVEAAFQPPQERLRTERPRLQTKRSMAAQWTYGLGIEVRGNWGRRRPRTVPELHEHFASDDLAAVHHLAFEPGRTLARYRRRERQCRSDAAGHDRNTQPGATHGTLPSRFEHSVCGEMCLVHTECRSGRGSVQRGCGPQAASGLRAARHSCKCARKPVIGERRILPPAARHRHVLRGQT